NIMPIITPSVAGQFGQNPDTMTHHSKEFYGYLVEIDPGKAAGEYLGKVAAGDGHRKIGGMGRARRGNATFAGDANWRLMPNQPIIVYGGDDRRGGRIFKFVTTGNYTAGMTKAQVRALLDSGKLYAAHFAGLDNTTGNTLLSTGMAPTEAAP